MDWQRFEQTGVTGAIGLRLKAYRTGLNKCPDIILHAVPKEQLLDFDICSRTSRVATHWTCVQCQENLELHLFVSCELDAVFMPNDTLNQGERWPRVGESS